MVADKLVREPRGLDATMGLRTVGERQHRLNLGDDRPVADVKRFILTGSFLPFVRR